MSLLRISVLDVGHGDFIYAMTPAGQALVIDCGSGDVVPANFLRNVTTISELQISHPHTDHFDDIIAMSKKTISSFRCPRLDNFTDDVIGWKSRDKAKIQKLRDMKRTLRSDDNAVPVGNGFSHSVWAPENIDANNPNSASYVTILSYGSFKMLFGGDLPDSGWKDLLKKPGFVTAISGTTIVKVSHHGRKEGRSSDLFNRISPKLCIISDKAIDNTNENTEATNWYTARSSGCKVRLSGGMMGDRKVLTTRNDKSIHIQANSRGEFWVFADTRWKDTPA